MRTRSSTRTPAAIELLPTELLQDILSFLCPTDFKSLRLSSKILENFASQPLFRRVPISFLKVHREALFAISSEERLARLVREVVWYECDVSAFRHRHEDSQEPLLHERDRCLGKNATLELQQINKDLYDLRECFWWPWERYGVSYDLDTIHKALRSLSRPIIGAFDRMPSLRVFISRGWPADLVLSAKQKEFTADMIQSASPAVGNIGLLLLLDYILSSRVDSLSLVWGDAWPTMPTFLYLERYQAFAFKHVKKLDLCISLTPEQESLRKLACCLYGAEPLEHLKLCCEQTLMDEPTARSIDFLLGFLVQFPSRPVSGPGTWSHLSNLELVDVRFSKQTFVDFLVRHAKSIRHVRLDDCRVMRNSANSDEEVRLESYESLVRALARLKTFNFHSIRLGIDYDDEEDDVLVDADALVKFVNNTGPCPFEEGTEYFYFNTHATTFVGSTSAAHFLSLATELENQHLSGEGSGEQGDEEEEEEEEEADDEASTVDAYETEGPERDWGELEADLYLEGKGKDHALSDDLDMSTYWVLKRIQNYIVWWDTKDATEGMYKTQQWLFERSDDSWAYGSEPLDFWEDWDRDDADLDIRHDEDSSVQHRASADWERYAPQVTREVKSTPFGPKFDEFCRANTYEDVDPLTVTYPPHARILVNDQTSMPFSEFVSNCWQARSAWESANQHRSVME
ncbi:hypothetical protein MMC10_004541 [Thelotrema lepadinum]|nr:hypothetical protein [Thelotrema lepadinum]